jgi:hypothetical protein
MILGALLNARMGMSPDPYNLVVKPYLGVDLMLWVHFSKNIEMSASWKIFFQFQVLKNHNKMTFFYEFN